MLFEETTAPQVLSRNGSVPAKPGAGIFRTSVAAPSQGKGGYMEIEQRKTRDRLYRIVARVARDPRQREDLLQEALLRFWILTKRHPGQRLSWYLCGCKLHLQNLQRIGCSVDSPKRLNPEVPVEPAGTGDEDEGELPGDEEGSGSPTFAEVSARDILGALSESMTSEEKQILEFLLEGFTARETAKELGFSHTYINKRRHRIASLASELGIEQIGKQGRFHSP